MFKFKIKSSLIIGLLSVLFFTSCEEENTYPPVPENTESSINLVYQKLTVYPTSEAVTDEPSFSVLGYYRITLDSVRTVEEFEVDQTLFAIDNQTGVISKVKPEVSLLLGTYLAYVSFMTEDGKVSFANPAEIEIVASPIGGKDK